MGDYAGAVEQLEKAVELVPQDPTINDIWVTPFGRAAALSEARTNGSGIAVRTTRERDQADRGEAAERPQDAAALDPARRLSQRKAAWAVRAFAPRRSIFYLHVIRRRADGYHLLDSLIASPISATRLPPRRPTHWRWTVDGPEAGRDRRARR